MDSPLPNNESSQIESWDTNAVASWLSSIGFAQYEKRFRENDITGDILLGSDDEMLKELGVKSVGHRIAILKALHKLKVINGYSETASGSKSNLNEPGSVTGSTADLSVTTPGPRSDMGRFEEMIRERDIIIDELFKQLSYLKGEIESMKATLYQTFPTSSHNTSPDRPVEDPNKRLRSQTLPTGSSKASSNHDDVSSPRQESGAIRVYGHKLLNHENESYKSILVSINDTCSKVLPLSMKKWKINDDWKKYALFMVVKGTERCLSYNDRPLEMLLVFRTNDETPVFILKALRTTESMMLSKTDLVRSSKYFDAMKSSSSLANHSMSDFTAAPTNLRPKNGASAESLDSVANKKDVAVAIYEYHAERDDELDVNIGDFFIVRDKNTTGWWVVEKEGRTGWVPAGCLMENSMDDEGQENLALEGVALYDYNAIGVNELSIKKGDQLIVQKKYQHWLLADCGSLQGWLPSCYVSVQEDNAPVENSMGSLNKINESPQTPTDPNVHIVRSNNLNFKNLNLSQNQSMSNSVDFMSKSHDSLAESVTAIQEFNNVVDKLKEVADVPTTKASFSPSVKSFMRKESSPESAVLSKLDSLLVSFNPYLADDTTEDPRPSKKTPLTELMTELSKNLTEWQDEASPHASHQSLNNVDSAAALNSTKQLVQLISTVSPSNENYHIIMDKLELIIEETKALATRPTDSIDFATPGTATVASDNIQTAIGKAYAGLTDVANLLLKEMAAGSEEALGEKMESRKNSFASLRKNSETDFKASSKSLSSKHSTTLLKRNPSQDFKDISTLPPGPLASPSVRSKMASDDQIDESSVNRQQFAMRVIPYEELVKRPDLDLDLANLEINPRVEIPLKRRLPATPRLHKGRVGGNAVMATSSTKETGQPSAVLAR